MHSLVIAGSLVIEFVNQPMIYGNTLHESCSLNKILQFNKEHGVNSPSRYRVSVQLEIVEFCHQVHQRYFVLIVLEAREDGRWVHEHVCAAYRQGTQNLGG